MQFVWLLNTHEEKWKKKKKRWKIRERNKNLRQKVVLCNFLSIAHVDNLLIFFSLNEQNQHNIIVD
jgi:hypothetical protein